MKKAQPAAKKTAAKKTETKVVKATSKKPVKKSKVKGFEGLPADAVEIESDTITDVTVIKPATAADQIIGEVVKPEMTGKEKFLSKPMRNDNIIVDVKLQKMAELTGLKVRKGFSVAVISEGEIVNVVSPGYGLVKNEDFFLAIEEKLIEADIKYKTRSINRGNSDFSVEYILADETFHVDVKGSKDKIIPMLRATNSYGGAPVTGSLGFYREVCSNGLHVAKTKVNFGMRHKSKVMEIVLPNIKELVDNFLSNEFYSLHKKFEVLAETLITDLTGFVKLTCEKTEIFNYEASKKNPEMASAKAKHVLETINKECSLLGVQPNYWIGYNAFNEVVHADKKSFNKQRKTDAGLFETIVEMAGIN